MTTTTFVDGVTVIEADWLNDANDVIYNLRNKPHIYHSGEFLEVQRGG